MGEYEGARVTDGRMPPFAWQEKEALRLMRDFLAGKALAATRLLYDVLTEIVSDHKWNDTVNTTQLPGGAKTILSYSGLTHEAYRAGRNGLRILRLVEVTENRNDQGHRTGHTIRLLRCPMRPEKTKGVKTQSLKELSLMFDFLIGESLIEPSPIAEVPIGVSDIQVVEEVGVVEESQPVEEVLLSSGGSPRPKREPAKRMKKEDLNRLTEHYAAIRGARPQGNAWKPIQQGFRQMVAVEGYTVEQVIGCMDRIVKLGWTWTINTVRTWIADFAAGTMPTKGLEAHHEPSQLQPGTSRGHDYYLGTGGCRLSPPGPPPTRDEAAGVIWDQAMEAARDELSFSEYETWFNEVTPVGVENGHLRVAVPDPFTKGGIERRYRGLVEELVTKVRGEPTELIIEVAE